MKNEMQVFAYGDDMVRTVEVNGDTWFVAKDVATILEYRNAPDMTRILDDDEKLIRTVCVSGQGRETTLINESGLYHAIFQSRKAEAKRFRKWVTSEVLPAIRKTGGYGKEQIADIAEQVATVMAERMADSIAVVAERAVAAVRDKALACRPSPKRQNKESFRASKEQCGDVLAFCDRYCDVSGDKNTWCKLTDLYGVYKVWVDDKAGKARMPRFKFSNALGQLYSIIHVTAQSPRGENVYTIRGMRLKNRYWEL